MTERLQKNYKKSAKSPSPKSLESFFTVSLKILLVKSNRIKQNLIEKKKKKSDTYILISDEKVKKDEPSNSKYIWKTSLGFFIWNDIKKKKSQ